MIFNDFLVKKMIFRLFFLVMTMGIKKFRERLGIKTQAALAKMLEINQANVSEWEIGKGSPSYAVLKKLFEMGATVEEVFGVPYKGKSEGINLASLSDAEVKELVRRGLAGLAAGNGVG